MKKLFGFADVYLARSNWKDLTLIKFCLFSMGLLAGMQIPRKSKKPAGIAAAIVSVLTYVPLMAKFFGIVFEETEEVTDTAEE